MISDKPQMKYITVTVCTIKTTVCSTQCTFLSYYQFLHNSLVIKLQSLRCSWCSCSCLSCLRRLRLYFCDAADCGGSSWYRVCCGLFNILSNSWSSASCNSWSKSGKSVGQKSHRMVRLRNASTRWRSVAVVNPLHAGLAYVSRDTTTARKTACRPISVMPWCMQHAQRIQRLRAVTNNSTDMFRRWQVACDSYTEDFQHILTGSGLSLTSN